MSDWPPPDWAWRCPLCGYDHNEDDSANVERQVNAARYVMATKVLEVLEALVACHHSHGEAAFNAAYDNAVETIKMARPVLSDRRCKPPLKCPFPELDCDHCTEG